MKPSLLAAALALAVSLAACQRPAADTTTVTPATTDAAPASAASTTPATPAPATDLAALAQRLVNQSAAVKEGEIVMITGRQQDAALMENIAVEVARVGAHPMIDYSSDALSKRLFFDVPEKYDSQPDTLGMKLADMLDVVISLGNGTSEDLLAGADPKRVFARGKAGEAVGNAFTKNNVRMVEVGNNLYPTSWRAERYGLSQDELTRMFWEGVNLDYSGLQARGEQVRAALAAGNEVHITNPNGTDLKLRVQGQPVGVSDGFISADDIKKGGPAVQVYLPAGEVYTTPVPGSAEGKVVQTLSYYRGKQVDNLTVTLAGGKLIEMTGSGPGYAELRADYDAMDDARKDVLGYLDLDINPNIKLPASSKVGTWVPAGAVTVGLGGNTWAGGDNSLPFDRSLTLPGSTVTLDGKAIVEKGELKL